MTNIELKEFLTGLDQKLSAQLQTQTTIIDEVIRPKLDEFVEHVKQTDVRVAEIEKREISQRAFCKSVQESKKRDETRDKDDKMEAARVDDVKTNKKFLILYAIMVVFGLINILINVM